MKKVTLLVITASALLFMSGTIYLDSLFNYANQTVPNYINKDNTNGNPITDQGATLGRVLFYDKQLSANGNIACASCHKQEFAFSDTAVQSVGLSGGLTGRHSMRLVNARFADEGKFFWDERATSLEDQTTKPIQDHIEMGFSGTNGDPGIDSLIRKLETIDYYNPLFTVAFGDAIITENRMQQALAQFIRSIQSFDSKYDQGRVQVNNDATNFPNFTASENAGKQLFLAPPPAGGAGCAGCHRPPEFDIDPATGNNGTTGLAGSQVGTDYTNTKAPSLRDIVNPSGDLNGPLMHTGEITTLEELIDHYNAVPQDSNNTNLDNRLAGPGGNLNLTNQEKADLVAFLGTLTGSNIYTNEIWSDPFDENGNLTIEGSTGIAESIAKELQLFPNPASNFVQVAGLTEVVGFNMFSVSGQLIKSGILYPNERITVNELQEGVYFISLTQNGEKLLTIRFVKSH